MSRATDLDAFSDFVRDRGGALRRTAYLFTRDWYLADDLVQSALIRTFERLPRIRDPRALESYTRKVISSLFLSGRRLKSAGEIAVDSVPEGTGTDTTGAVADAVVMWAALGLLTEMQRAVLVLRYYEDASEAEIAHTLGCSKGSVKSHASRGIASLRTAFEQSDRDGFRDPFTGESTDSSPQTSPTAGRTPADDAVEPRTVS